MESGRDARARLGFVYIFAVIKWIKDPSENVTARAFQVVLLCKNVPLALNHICIKFAPIIIALLLILPQSSDSCYLKAAALDFGV